MSVIDKDKGWKRIKESFNVADSFVKVGILSSAQAPEDSSMTMAKLAAVHEFGSPAHNIPDRPFIRQTIDRIKGDIIKFNKNQYDQIIQGKTTVYKALASLGVYVTREMKRQFNIGNFAKNKPATIAAKKGSSKPLIDTGRLRNSINFEVVEK